MTTESASGFDSHTKRAEMGKSLNVVESIASPVCKDGEKEPGIMLRVSTWTVSPATGITDERRLDCAVAADPSMVRITRIMARFKERVSWVMVFHALK